MQNKVSYSFNYRFPKRSRRGIPTPIGGLTTSYNLQGTVYHNTEFGSPVYVGFMDTQKAFNTMW